MEDRHSFLRSLANKTAGMQKGETRDIFINGANNVYYFHATGYMNGKITSVKQISLSEGIGDYYARINRTAEVFDTWVEDFSNTKAGHNRNYDISGNRRGTDADDRISTDTSRSNTRADIGEIEEDFESAIENLPPGALVYFGNGKYYKVPYRSNSGSGNKETSADTEEGKLTNSKTKKSTAPTNLKGVQDLVEKHEK